MAISMAHCHWFDFFGVAMPSSVALCRFSIGLGLLVVLFCLVVGCETSPTKPAGDFKAPAAITDLVVTGSTDSSITLEWTTPGDDGTEGRASSYDLRSSTSPITATTFASDILVTGEPVPALRGVVQPMKVSGLKPSTTYYFAIKTADEVPNVSGLSNVVV